MNGSAGFLSPDAAGRNGNGRGDGYANGNAEELISIDSMNIYEQEKLISSPRSLEACALEGVMPKELLYIPLETYK